jgi:hypothetical protein
VGSRPVRKCDWYSAASCEEPELGATLTSTVAKLLPAIPGLCLAPPRINDEPHIMSQGKAIALPLGRRLSARPAASNRPGLPHCPLGG